MVKNKKVVEEKSFDTNQKEPITMIDESDNGDVIDDESEGDYPFDGPGIAEKTGVPDGGLGSGLTAQTVSAAPVSVAGNGQPWMHSQDIDFMDVKLGKMEEEINLSMANCNDIERSISPVLKKGSLIRENLLLEAEKKGERAMLYELASIINDMSASLTMMTGYTKNIKFANGRLQEMIDDLNERIVERYGGKNE
jgi:hypothetical protein